MSTDFFRAKFFFFDKSPINLPLGHIWELTQKNVAPLVSAVLITVYWTQKYWQTCKPSLKRVWKVITFKERPTICFFYFVGLQKKGNPWWGEGDIHSFYLRPTNDVTEWYLRHVLTRIDSDPQPFRQKDCTFVC